MARTVADQLVETLAARVRRIYGGVGDSLNGITDAIRRHGKIEWLHVRHDRGLQGTYHHWVCVEQAASVGLGRRARRRFSLSLD